MYAHISKDSSAISMTLICGLDTYIDIIHSNFMIHPPILVP